MPSSRRISARMTLILRKGWITGPGNQTSKLGWWKAAAVLWHRSASRLHQIIKILQRAGRMAVTLKPFYTQSSKVSHVSYDHFLISSHIPHRREKVQEKKVKIGYMLFLCDKLNFVFLAPFQFLLPIFTAQLSFFIKYHLCWNWVSGRNIYAWMFCQIGNCWVQLSQ